MSIAAVGSIAFDSVSTPFGSAQRELGGSAVYAAMAAACFTRARVVGVVGGDFDESNYEPLRQRGVIVDDIVRVEDAETFSWTGSFDFDLSVAHTTQTALNVFEGWKPSLSPAAQCAEVLFLGNMDPEVQLDVRRQWRRGRLAALDSMDYWIANKREALIEAIRGVDIVLLNDQEIRHLTGKSMLLAAAREIRAWGPHAVVIKLGEYGCALLHLDSFFSLPGYPLESAADPSGAGDAFAGGFLGYLDLARGDELTEEALRRAVMHGSVMASFCVEAFGVHRLIGLTEHEILYRVGEFRSMTHFEHVPTSQLPRQRDPRDEGGVLDRPHSTPSTTGYDQPMPTPGIPSYRRPPPTPGTAPREAPRRPLPHEPKQPLAMTRRGRRRAAR